MAIKTKILSSLEKVMPSTEPHDSTFPTTCLKGEVYSFQVAIHTDSYLDRYQFELETDIPDLVSARLVDLAAVECFGQDIDENIIDDKPGLFPDMLSEIEAPFKLPHNQWRAFWFTVKVPADFKAGDYYVGMKFNYNEAEDKTVTVNEGLKLTVLDAALETHHYYRTEWFHTDCIYSWYNVPCWSDAHWDLLEKYFKNAADHGINLLLTPLFTPPLDTAVGGERPTVQLIDVTYENDSYSFDFEKLDKWLTLARKNGIENFEMSHLFTQWGAKFTPKIIVQENGEANKKFGWHVEADSAEYKQFLNAFMPELVDFIKNRQLEKNCIFHISDEPGMDHIESYGKAYNLVIKYLDGFKIIDALSNVDFYKQGLVKNPVPSNDHFEPFYAEKQDNMWTYYCCSQRINVPNRFIYMPSTRARIMGMLMYKYDLEGFLHWGYNFWYSQHSLRPIDPFRVNDSAKTFPAGDPFLVYPGPDGPIDSIRNEVCYESFQDLNALRSLEQKIGRDKVMAIVERDGELTMKQYPQSAEWLLETREMVNQQLAQ